MILPFLTHGWWVLGQTHLQLSRPLCSKKYEVQSNSAPFPDFSRKMSDISRRPNRHLLSGRKKRLPIDRETKIIITLGAAGWRPLSRDQTAALRERTGARERRQSSLGKARERSFSQAAEAASCGRGRIHTSRSSQNIVIHCELRSRSRLVLRGLRGL